MTKSDNIQKFVVTRAASRAKRILCAGAAEMKFAKPYGNRRARRKTNQAIRRGDYDFAESPVITERWIA